MSLDKLESSTLRIVFRCTNEEQMQSLEEGLIAIAEFNKELSVGRMTAETLSISIDIDAHIKSKPLCDVRSDRTLDNYLRTLDFFDGYYTGMADRYESAEVISKTVPQFD